MLVEVAIGFASAIAMVALRLPMNSIAGDRAPYALNFLAVVIASVLAGWRSGLIALVIAQLLTWYIVVPVEWSFRFENRELLGGFVLACLSQLLILTVIALYQREIDKGVAERDRRLTFLDDALREIDHRTRNNYQTVLAMIELQSRRSSEGTVREALSQVADRIQAVANASQQLAKKSVDIDSVRLDDHLCGLVQQIERGLSRDGIDVDCEVEEVTASADAATSISIIVNELVTNAIKHAFNGEGVGHVRVVGRTGSSFELTVSDNGRGIQANRRDGQSGLGTKLVESFARQLRAKHEVVSTDQGTMHRLVIPSLQ